jgi:hypothetical protein
MIVDIRRRDYNLLLTFLSELGAGDWATFKDACRWISERAGHEDDRAWIIASNLAALGHLEFDFIGSLEWSISPPVLTMLPYAGGWAALCGSRTRFGIQKLGQTVESLDLWIESFPQEDGPDAILIQTNRVEQIEELADACGFRFTYLVSQQLASLLPPLQRYVSLAPSTERPIGFEIERFAAERLEWISADDDNGNGLYRYRTYQRPEIRLRDGRTRKIPIELGTYEWLRTSRRSVLIYRQRAKELLVPARARLPVVHARTATLCSGSLPRFEREVTLTTGRRRWSPTPYIAYRNVPKSIAWKIAGSLEQGLCDEASHQSQRR